MSTSVTTFVVFKSAMVIDSAIKAVSKAVEAASAANQALSFSFISAGTAASGSATSLTLFQTVMGLLTGKIQLATVAQTAWNAVAAISPWAIAAAAIAGLAVGVNALGKAMQDTTQATKDMSRETNELLVSSKSLEESIFDGISAYNQKMIKLGEDAELTRNLTEEILALSEASELSADDQDALRAKIAELNTLVPELNLAYNEQTGHLNKTREELEALNRVQEAYLTKQEAEARYSEIRKNQQAATEKLTELEGRREITLAAIADAQERVNTLSGTIHFVQLAQANNDLEEHQKNLDAIDFEYATLSDDAEILQQKATGALDDITTSTDALEEATAALITQEKERKDALQAITDKYDPLNQKTKDFIGTLRESIKEMGAQATEFDKSQQAIKTETALMANLAAQAGELSSKTSLTADEQARLAAIGVTLNNEIPSLNLVFDEQGRIISHTAEEIAAYAEAQAAHLSYTDAEKRLTEVFREQTSTTELLRDANEELDTIRQESAQIVEEMTRLEDENGNVLAGNEEAYAALAEQLGIRTDRTEELSGVIGDLTERERLYGEQLLALGYTVEEAEAAIAAAREKGILVGDEAVEAEKRQLEERKKITEDLAAAQNKLIDEMTKSYAPP